MSVFARLHACLSACVWVCGGVCVRVGPSVSDDVVVLMNSVTVVAIGVRKPFPQDPKRS